MLERIENLEFVTFTRKDLDYFKELILPNVYEQLFLTEDFEEEAVYCIAATVDNIPVAVLVAQLFENEEVLIHSIVVGIEYRRMGIGREMIQNLMTIANEEFDPYLGEGDNVVGLFMHTEYALDTEMGKNYESFLRAVGFTDFFDMPPVYYFTRDELKTVGGESNNVHKLTKIEHTNEDMLFAYFAGLGLTPAVNYSYFSGTEDKPGVIVLAQYDDDNVITLSSALARGDVSVEEYGEVVNAVVDAIKKDNEDFTIIVNSDLNAMPEFWEEFSKAHGIKCEHREAGLYAQFE